MIGKYFLFGFWVTMMMVGCTGKDSTSYTLYRNSLVDSSLRLHVASFDSADGAEYNRENCEVASVLFLNQPSVKTKFWCEKGSYKP